MKQEISHKYHVFISYSRKDNDWVQKSLVPKLKETNLKIFHDESDIKGGESWASGVENAIKNSEYTIIVLTPDYLNSKWASFENLLVKCVDPVDRQKRVIPILLRECDPPLRIKNLACLDFTDEKSEKPLQFERFLQLFSSEKKESKKLSEQNRWINFSKKNRYMDYDLIKLSSLCRKSFTDRELIDLSYDNFSKVYENFSLEMSKEAKVRLILEFCERYQMIDKLLDFRVAE